jgi:hypothetical protein
MTSNERRVLRRALEALWPVLDRDGLMRAFDAASVEEASALGDVFEGLCCGLGYEHPPWGRPDPSLPGGGRLKVVR